MQGNSPLNEIGMALDEPDDGCPDQIRLPKPGSNQVERMAHSDEPKPAFHRRDIMHPGQIGIRIYPGEKLRLHCCHRPLPQRDIALRSDMGKHDELL